MLAEADAARAHAAALAERVSGVVQACQDSLAGGGRLFFCGNGGSMAEAMHLATELSVRLRSHVARDSLPGLALAADAATLTAGGNDFGFDQVFARPLRGLARRGDVLLVLSTSGRSANVVIALQAARGMGVVTVGLLGGDGGPAAALCDHLLLVPGCSTARTQEVHLLLGHALLELLEDRLVTGG